LRSRAEQYLERAELLKQLIRQNECKLDKYIVYMYVDLYEYILYA